MTYTAPLADMRFALREVAGLSGVAALPGYEHATDDTIDAVLEEAGKLAGNGLAPLNREGDKVGARLENGVVRTAPGFAAIYKEFVGGGWNSLPFDPEFGGQGMPWLLATAVQEMWQAANMGFGLVLLLNQGAIDAIHHHGSDAQKAAYLPKMISGEWTGTMNLTEPQAGSDLGQLKSRAVKNGDHYLVSGQKIFITYGEHDMAENIVHLVLARLPDAPAGVKGISLFIVPKFQVARDGTVGARNAVRCGSIEHKMGIHGSVTCVMNFDGAQGYLIGQPNKGLNAMFVMMNSARLGVGMQSVGLAEVAYQNSLAYAKDRLQSRSLTGAKREDKPADPIIVHPDIRRMLLTCKAFAEGGRALALHAASLVDVVERSTDADEKKRADELLSFLTPIVKACLTEWSIESTYNALQCFGGHGYVAEWGMEQLARDARITTIYEGTTGIQALDLLGRKTLQTQGMGLKHFLG
ncbi:MAG: acyl-CoA dehydrogenase family protein, partial [Pseudomonadota bacterium]|nr:acyl-CoA dehydrogenase family protein [Pseudomonadota bacterium]